MEDGLNSANLRIGYAEVSRDSPVQVVPELSNYTTPISSSAPIWYKLPSGERVTCITSQMAIDIADAHVNRVYQFKDALFLCAVFLFLCGLILIWDQNRSR